MGSTLELLLARRRDFEEIFFVEEGFSVGFFVKEFFLVVIFDIRDCG